MKDVIIGLATAILITIAGYFVKETVSLYFFVIILVISYGVVWVVDKISKYISKDKKSKQFKG
ncbi:hypothetical protein [Paenibacillus sp. RC84]|uniref:hypothetical protein n=1 Tax=Paenibacillus sp. RC84 TaxID=3156252 RepID=UPI003513F1C1